MKTCKCGQKVASNARVCPHCGNRFTHPFVKFLAVCFGVFIVLGIIGAIIGGSMGPTAAPDTPQSIAEKKRQDDAMARAMVGAASLRAGMRDPESLTLDSVLGMQSGAICYEYRARNGFNGMNREHAVLPTNAKFLNTTAAAWNHLCANKSGDDYTAAINASASLWKDLK